MAGTTLVRLNKRGDFVIDEDAVKLAPKLGKLSKLEVLFVSRLVDYHSPYSQLPESERLKRVKRETYGDDSVTPESQQHVIDAIGEYSGLQFDVDRETLRNYEQKRLEYSEKIRDEQDPRKIAQYDAASDVLNRRCDELRARIEKRNERDYIILKGGKTLSFVEDWQNNKRENDKLRDRQRKNKAAEEQKLGAASA